MTQSRFQRVSAVSLALTGLLLAIFWITHAETLADPVAYQRQHWLGLAGSLLLPVGLTGIGLRLLAVDAGTVGLVGFLLAFLSSLLSLAISATDAFVWPAIARAQPELILTAAGVFDPDSPVYTSNFALIGAALPLVVVGYGALGLALWQSRAFSRPATILLVLAAWATAFAPGLVPHGALLPKVLVYSPLAIALVWMGAQLWRGDTQSERKGIAEP
ncbi:MAG: hypothetical protein HY328_09755 [Chloroflexi bacterium]|nr:hypothetical protein [Chloroflexota bacterium]